MNRPITISLSPNTEPDDVRRAWRVLIRPNTWKDQGVIDRITQVLELWYPEHATVFTSSGRSALYATLKAFGIGPGDEVILQAFTCIAVPEPMLWVGATPVYADIDPGTYNLDVPSVQSKITPRTKAIIIQHTFGIPGPLAELRQLADTHKVALIEDCAHAIGAIYRNKPVGTVGDAAIFSFGRDKALSSVFGGAVVSKDRQLVENIQVQQSALPYPPARWVMQQLLHPILMDIIVPNYFRAGFGKIYLMLFQKLGLLSKAVAAEEKTAGTPSHVGFRYSPALAQLLELQLEKLDRFIERRRAIAHQYMDALSRVSSIELPSVPEDTQPSWLRFPIQIENATEVLRKARANRMLLGDWYNAPLVPGDCDLEQFKYRRGSCPRAEEAAQHVVNLPTYPLLRDKQVEEVIKFLESGIKN